MKVQIQPGRAVQLDARRSTSVKGGTYDLERLGVSEADRKRILATPGVSVVKASTPAAAEK